MAARSPRSIGDAVWLSRCGGLGRFGGFTDRIVADSFRKRSEREGSVGVVVVAVGLFGGEQGAIDAAQGNAEGFQQMVRHQHLLG